MCIQMFADVQMSITETSPQLCGRVHAQCIKAGSDYFMKCAQSQLMQY